jgi:phospholipid-binding lipoprotein MlaA
VAKLLRSSEFSQRVVSGQPRRSWLFFASEWILFVISSLSFSDVPTSNIRAAAMAAALLAAVFAGSGCGKSPRPVWAENPAYLQSLQTGQPQPGAQYFAQEEVDSFEAINDPIERVNRAVWGFNNFIIVYLANPATRFYRWFMPEGAREAIRRAGKNLAAPVRVVNNLLQFDRKESWTEAKRFGINITLGIFGFFDPAKEWFDIQAPVPEDFGRTLGKWGWQATFYLVVPLMGPSNVRDFIGYIADYIFDLNNYIPGAWFLTVFNNLSYVLPRYNAIRETELDPYVFTRLAWTMTRDVEAYEYGKGDAEDDATQTLGAAFLAPSNEHFKDAGVTREAYIPSTGEWLPYTYWPRPEEERRPAPVAYILPGLSGHRLSGPSMGLAEALQERGFVPVTISSSMNWEFMRYAASVPVPGYLPQDARDVRDALAAVDSDLREYSEGPLRGGRAVLGMSLGGIHALMLAVLENEPGGMRFDRYVAINSPVDVLYAIERIDVFYNEPMRAWRPEVRSEQMRGGHRQGNRSGGESARSRERRRSAAPSRPRRRSISSA